VKIRNVLLLKLIILALLTKPFPAIAQSIEFTQIPPPGSAGYVYGIVHDADRTKYGVALFIEVFGTEWTKPTFDSPITPIQANGTFVGNIVTGGQDACAQTVSAYVVPLATDHGSIRASGQGSLPSALDQVSIAHTSALRSPVVALMFAGRVWQVKVTGDCVWGPGPNHFARDNAWVDAQGRLHLKISYVNGAWRCAEIISSESLGYGTYTFRFDSDVNGLPNPIVVGVFTYSHDPEYAHREIDVEFSNGAVVGAPQNWQFVVQPYTENDHRYRFSAPANMASSTQVITWSPGIASFKSFVGHPTIGPRQLVLDYSVQRAIIGYLEFNPPPSPGDMFSPVRVTSPTNITVLDTSDYSKRNVFYRARLQRLSETDAPAPFSACSTQSNVPPAGTEKVHLNIWLLNGTAPGSEDQEYEVIMRGFEFQPETIDLQSLRPRVELRNAQPSSKEIHVIYPAK